MQNAFVTIAKFQYSAEAEIIKGRLESDGIKVFLKDNITIDTDPLVSNAIGGIKLKVLAKDEDKAMDILKSINAYSINDNGEPVVCPNCGNNHIELYSTITSLKSLVSFLIGFITGTLPFSTRYQYKCEDCKTEFPIKN
ncbi:DUF2007 domain-containing protein [uncultured Winogradskyella sp.]|uniref:putative signal transducing protein n=1 Tax=uncultured Winogradskyella sp. TaxID=395353 RepID=UPI00260AEAE9|nr:DUF2007 domain-containing protein [uncultured Winogradskyella sp.]